MYQEYNVSYVPAKEWRLPLNLAIGFHLVIALAAIYLPDILDNKPRFENIHTIDLVNLAEIPQPEPAPAPPQAAQPQKAEPTPAKAVSIAPPPAPLAPAPAKAISIKPLKRKKVVAKKPPKQKSPSDAIKRKQLSEMLRAQQQALDEARILEQEAALEKQLADAARQRLSEVKNTNTSRQPRPAGTPGQSASQLSALEKQYFASVVAAMQPYWSLPEYKDWDPSLNALVVITIKKNGEIADSFFEARSGDKFFDRSVDKTLQAVPQLPPIPNALKKQRMEVGLRFNPQGIR